MTKLPKKPKTDAKKAAFKPPAKLRFPKAPLITWPDPEARNGIKAKATITDAGIRLVERLSRAAYPEYGISNILGVSQKTFKRMRDEQPKLQAALDAGHSGLEVELCHILLESAKSGYAPAAMFLLKTRCGYSEKSNPDGGPEVNVNITIPAPMSSDEFQKLIEAPKPEVIDVEFEEVPAPARGVIR